jgi:Methyltransferase domain
MGIKRALKSVLPKRLVDVIQSHQHKSDFAEYERMTPTDVFTKIYSDGAWGVSHDPEQKFFSGSGSHDEVVTEIYVAAVRRFINSLGYKPAVVDLGCGDFHVGAQLRDLCGKYIACDIVPSLVAFNQAKYKHLNVEFRLLNLADDALPIGDVIFIRQVLQHVSNDQIKKVVPKLQSSCKHLVLTEHLPESEDFRANIDMPTGPGIRLGLGSGVVITKPPFGLEAKKEQVLCEVRKFGGVVKTMLYTLNETDILPRR